MKTRIILIILTAVLLTGCMTYYPPSKARIYLDVKKELPKDKIYDLCMSYIAHSYNNPNRVIQYQNKESGEIVVHALMNAGNILEHYVPYIMTIKVKDNGYRVEMVPKIEYEERYNDNIQMYFLSTMGNIETYIDNNK